MRNLRNSKGFTLIELMIVVVIIGILAAIAIPRFTAVSASAKQAEAGPILKQICSLASAQHLRTDEWPSSIDEITGWDPATNENAQYFTFSFAGHLATATADESVDGIQDQIMNCQTGVLGEPGASAPADAD